MRSFTFIGLSEIKHRLDELPAAYEEAAAALAYKLTHHSHIMDSSVARQDKEAFEYPARMEGKIVNTIMA
ncbi:MAG: hypothetical protein ACM3ZC_00520 [Bacteroidota bacterium]